MNNYPRLVVAGLKGGAGKTTLSLGLLRAFRGKGLMAVPFKKGPDYIDAGWLASAAEHPCYNLDPYLVGRDRVLSSFIMHAKGSDVAVMEGNRGLFDGMDEEGSYSTAEVAKILRSPVILTVDCTKATRTIAALVLGVENFDRDVVFKGVVLNQIAGSRHESVIRKSIEKYCGVPVLGAIPRLDSGMFPERHMGLLSHQEHPDTTAAISFMEELARRYLAVEEILKIARDGVPLDVGQGLEEDRKSHGLSSQVTIGVIRDSAFQFYYPENLEELRRNGAAVFEVSALQGKQMPDIDALYIGGGFPETHAVSLAENVLFRDSLKEEIEKGLPVYAECGGLMYLGKGLLLDGRMYPMAGVFPMHFSLERKPQAHGYSIAEVVKRTPFFPKGTILKGHEFHYSKVCDDVEETNVISFAFTMKRGQGIFEKKDGICYKNVLATYTHLHAYGTGDWAAGMVRQAAEFKERKAFQRSRNGG